MVDYSNAINAEHGLAGANLNAAQGVDQGAALSALKDGPAVGVHPDLAMKDPGGVASLAASQAEQTSLQHPAIRSWATTGAANVAATKGDWDGMAAVAQAAKDFISPIRAAVGQLGTDVGRFARANPNSGNLLPGSSEPEQRAGSVLGDALLNVPGSPFAGLANVLARPLSNVAPVPKLGGGVYSQEESQRMLAGDIATSFMGYGGGRGIIPRAGVVDFGTLRGVDVPEGGSPQPLLPGPKGLLANHAAEATANLQDGINSLSFHSQAPNLTEDFLANHTDVGGQSVFIDPHAVVEQYSKGHEPLSSFGPQIADALAQGRDLEVPYSTYLSQSAGQPWAEELNKAIRFNDGGVSVNEAEDAASLAPLREEIEGQPGVNIKRMADLLGTSMYGDPSVLPQITAKEVLQNSADAVRQVWGDNPGGHITVERDQDNRTLTFHDNGIGMGPDLLGGKFLQIAGTEKGSVASGGFGLAKMAFLYGNNALKVETMRDGKFSTMETSGPELMAALEGGVKPRINVRGMEELSPEERALFPEGHGTRISLQIPQKYTDKESGQEKDIPFPYDANDIPALGRSPLFAPVDVRFKRGSWDGAEPVLGSGMHFDAPAHTTFANVKFPWGNARLYVRPRKEGESKYDNNVHVLSNGLWQFSFDLKKSPTEYDNLPFTIYIDVNPSVKPEAGGYPFGFNRQHFTPQAQKDFSKILSYIQAVYGAKSLAEDAADFHSVRYLQGDGTLGPNVEMKPELPPSENALDKSIKEGDKVEVVDGKLLVNGEELPELSFEDLKAAVPKAEELKVPQDRVDAGRVMVHDNTEINSGDFEGQSVGEVMEAKFGPQWGEFLQYVGDSMLTLRDEVARIMGYLDLAREATGISLDKSYRGVSIKVPFSGMFINPLMAESADPYEGAFGTMGTMIHEFAHHKVRSHNASFPAEMQRIYYKLQAETSKGGFDFVGFQDTFAEALVQHYGEVISYGNELFQGGVGSRGKSFSDASYQSRADGGDERDAEGVGQNLRPALQAVGGSGEGGGRGAGDGGVPGADAGNVGGNGGVDRMGKLSGDIASAVSTTRSALGEVERELGLRDLFYSPKDAGLTKPQMGLYASKLEAWRQSVEDKVVARLVKDFYAEATPAWKEEVASQRALVEKEFASQPLLQVYSALVRSKGVLGEPLQATKLAKDDQLGKLGVDLGLPKSMFGKDGLSADELAGVYGYPSGGKLITDLGALRAEMGGREFGGWLKGRVDAEAEQRAREKLGFDLSREAAVQRAYEEAAVPAIEDLIAGSLRDLGREIGRPVEAKDVEMVAGRSFAGLEVKEARNPKVFERAVKSTGEKALKALEKSDFTLAFNHRWQQLLNFGQLKLSWAFKKEVEKAEGKFQRWADKKAIGPMDPTIGAVLQKALGEIDFRLKRDEGELNRFLQNAAARGLPSTLAEAVDRANDFGYALDAVGVKELANASVAEFREMRDMLIGLAEFGKELRAIYSAGKAWELTGLANEVQANAAELGRNYTPQQLADNRRTAFGKFKSDTKALLVGNLRPEVYLHWMDKSAQGPLMKYVVNPLQEGKYKETELVDGWIKAIKGAVKGEKGFFGEMGKGVDAPEMMAAQTPKGPVVVVQTRGNLRTALLYLGSESARGKLLEGYGWGEQQEKWLLENATESDWKWVRAFWAENDKLFKLADEMYGRVRGYGLVSDEPREVVLPDGRSFPGGHVHITYDPSMKALMQMVEVGEEELLTSKVAPTGDVMDEHPARALPSAFYGVARTGFVGPVNLNPHVLSAGISEIIHDISFREPLVQAQKVVSDPRVKEAMASVLGPEYQKQMFPWLRYIATERMMYDSSMEDIAQRVRNFRNNYVFAKVAFNLSSALKHGGLGLAHMTREVGDPIILQRAISDLTGPNAGLWRKFVKDNSGEVAGIGWNVDYLIREALGTDVLTDGKVEELKKAGFALFTALKSMEAHVTWLAKYRVGMHEHGVHDAAVAEANKAVRDTQGAGAPVDTVPMLRHGESLAGEIGKSLVGFLMNFHITSTNRLFTAKREIGQGVKSLRAGEGEEAAGHFGKAGGLILAYVLLAALWLAFYEIYVRGGGDPKKGKTEDFEHEFFWGIAEQTLGGFVGANYFVDAAKYGSSKGTKAGGVFGGVADDVMKATDIGNAKFWTRAVKAFGEITGTIPEQAVNVASAGGELARGEIGPVGFAQRGLLGRQGMEGGTGRERASRPHRAARASRGGGTK